MTTHHFSREDLQTAAAALAHTEDDLLLDLGAALAGPGTSRDGDPDDLRGRANNWFDRNRDALRDRLCGSTEVDRFSDTAIDVAAVADLIAGITGKPAAFTVAAIILKRGLIWLCG